MEHTKRKKIVEQLNRIQEEIFMIGWNGILEKYHPDKNIDNVDAEAIFKIYKTVFENIKKRIVII